jgi:hypothetical protein
LPLEVVDQGLGIFTNISEVHSLSTTLEEEQSIEGLEQYSTRLMDGAKDSLAIICEFSEKGAN